MYYHQSYEDGDCLSWCYFFVPLFENQYLMLGCLLLSLISCITCHPLLLFSSGVTIIVFWTLTCLQCPIPCQLYTEMCDSSYKCFVRLDMIWCWPILACLSLMLSYLFHLKQTGIISISCSCEKLRKKSSNNKNPTENQNISLTLQQKKKKVEVVTTKSVEIKNGCTNV